MKAILEFDLDDRDDKMAHKRAISATDAYLVLLDIKEYLRNRLKYEEMSEDKVSALEETRTELSELLNKYSIDMSNLE